MEQNDMELIYDKFSNTIYRTAFSYCKNHADAEDITSDVFIKCFTGKYAYDSDEHLKAWLIRCTINRCKDIFKSFRFKHVVALDDAEIVYESPEESTVFHEVMNLPEKYRIVILLFYYEGYSTKEIAEILKKRHYNPEQPDAKEMQKQYGYLMRRGYKSEDILRVMKCPDYLT